MTFELNLSTWSNDQKTSVSYANAIFSGDAAEKGYVVLDNRKGPSYFQIQENKLNYDGSFYTIDLRIRISPEADKTMILAEGMNLPITIVLERVGNGSYRPYVRVTTDNKPRELRCVTYMKTNIWYDLRVVLLDNEFLVMLDNETLGRRVYDQEPVIGKRTDTFFRIGLSANKNSTYQGFIGDISRVTLNNSVSEADQDISDELDQKGYGEINSKYADIQLEGINPGLMTQAETALSPHSDAYYTRYQNGTIIWSTNDCAWMPNAMFDRYLELISTTLIGLPKTDAHEGDDGRYYVIFDYATMVMNNGEIILIPDVFHAAYLAAGMDTSVYGAPVSGVSAVTCAGKKLRYMEFQHYNMVASDGDEPFPVHKNHMALYFLYPQHEKLLGVITGRAENHAGRTCIPCDLGDLWYNGNGKYYVVAGDFRKHFHLNREKLQYPVDDQKSGAGNTTYQNFKGGVIVRYGDGTVRVHTSLTYTLSHIRSWKIDDGYNDEEAELYIKEIVDYNGKLLANQRRWPDEKDSKHGKTSFDIVYGSNSSKKGKNVSHEIPVLQGEDVITMSIGVYDYDSTNKDDLLGSFYFIFDISNGWGLDKVIDAAADSSRIMGDQTVYNGVHLTNIHDGVDYASRIKLDFSVSEPVPYDLDSFFTKYGFWPIKNFSTTGELDRETYNSVFSDSLHETRWYDYIANPFADGWFSIVKGYCGGKGGLCFGMSLEALRAIHGRSVYQLPLNTKSLYITEGIQYQKVDHDTYVEPGFCNIVRRDHLYQLGMKHVYHCYDCAIRGEMFSPFAAFRGIVNALSKDKYCLVNLWGGKRNGKDLAHTVLAYDYEPDPETGSYKIYVADSNHPWWFYLNEDERKDDSLVTQEKKRSSYIRISIGCDASQCKLKDRTCNAVVDAVVSLYADNAVSLCFPYVYATRYHTVEEQPRQMNWADIIALVLSLPIAIPVFTVANFAEFIIMMVTGDADIEEATSDGKKLDVLTLPMGEHTLKIVQGVTESGNLSVKFRGRHSGQFQAKILGRNKLTEISGATEANKLDVLELGGFNTRRPVIKKAGENNLLKIQCTRMRYGKVRRGRKIKGIAGRPIRRPGSAIRRPKPE